MFGFFKWRRVVGQATEDAVYCCRAMFAGLEAHGKAVPNQVFGDAYVLGFLQQLMIYAVHANQRRTDDAPMMLAVAEATMEALVPGFGKKVLTAFAEVNDPAHPMHENYRVGFREGLQYTMSLLHGDVATTQDRMVGFRAFVKRNYLGG